MSIPYLLSLNLLNCKLANIKRQDIFARGRCFRAFFAPCSGLKTGWKNGASRKEHEFVRIKKLGTKAEKGLLRPLFCELVKNFLRKQGADLMF
ncbi:MAG: hypothetical protein IJ034_00790 [Mailhella sp.]|nr:hypothetical protein [Mailhella sp.]